jgi:hypothetical protein
VTYIVKSFAEIHNQAVSLEHIRSKTRLFADDTIVYLTITSDIDSVSLQDDLNKLAKWEERWKMSFHPEKCNVLTVSRKKQPITNPDSTVWNLMFHLLLLLTDFDRGGSFESICWFCLLFHSDVIYGLVGCDIHCQKLC